MVAVSTVFGLQLPVTRSGRYRWMHHAALPGPLGTGQSAYPGWYGDTKVFFQVNHVRIQGTKEEAAVAFKAWHAAQVMAAVGAEVLWVSTGFFILNLAQQPAVVREGPPVEWTGGVVGRFAGFGDTALHRGGNTRWINALSSPSCGTGDDMGCIVRCWW